MMRFSAVFLMVGWILVGSFAMAGEAEGGNRPKTSSMTSQPTPEILSVEGIVTSIDLKSSPASLKVTPPKGKAIVLFFDGRPTPVWNSGKKMDVSELRAGNIVRVRYLRKDEKDYIKSIEFLGEEDEKTD